MNTPIPELRIDFVSDLVCPWCAIAFKTLEQVRTSLAGELTFSWHSQPFELNPNLGAQGEELVQHLSAKYGGSPAQFEQLHQTIAERGRAVRDGAAEMLEGQIGQGGGLSCWAGNRACRLSSRRARSCRRRSRT